MTATLKADRSRPGQDDLGQSLQDRGVPQEFLAPVIAGAFARGIAEAFNLLAVPAFFLDRDGLVLFASDAAAPWLAQDLALRAGHLLAHTEPDNASLAAFMAEILRDPGGRCSTKLPMSGVALSALPPPSGPALADQLLHAIVVIGPTEGAPRAAAQP